MTLEPLVHVVDDEVEIRESLQLLLDSVGLENKAYASADEFLAEYVEDPDRPSVLLLDVRMPGMSGMALLERLHTGCGAMPIIIITGHGDIDMAVRAMKLGAVDFITKPFSSQSLLDRLQEVLRKTAERAAQERMAQGATARFDALTAREREIFDRIVAGESNKAIAYDLGISVRTVESHRASIMEKLEARTLVDLVMLSVSLKGGRM
jgi:FixJ family two-component response regulator